MTLPRFVTIHGHFYQPPRENPWLEAVEVQDSAAPAHDWNERVADECYAPNTAARRLSAENRIIGIVNNFEKISFNVGPTLMAWLASHRPHVYASLLEADRTSRQTRGFGNAIAQVYNHMILPLASRRDKVTQIRWGLADFRARFGREPEGMWLPETAVDSETLDVLAEAGIRFTILAPHQAARTRPLTGGPWTEVGESIDPSRAYTWRGLHGATLDLFFYDAPVSRAIAFENALQSGETLAARLLGAFRNDRRWPQLVHCATDGESYGHHSRFGEMGLAAALERLEARGDVLVTNYAAFLAGHPSTVEVEIREATSWSCAHGVERWRNDCGCRFDSATEQEWRAPLRETLDWLRGEIDSFYEAHASGLLKDPWAARDAYIDVILDRQPAALASFLAAHATGALDATTQVETRRLLEMQRHRLLMYTSCGWFFDDLAGLEAVQNLRYAAMALGYLRELGGPDLESALVERVGRAVSNDPEAGTGADVYRQRVRSAAADVRRLAAHYAISGLFEAPPRETRLFAYHVTRLDDAHAAYADTALRVGRIRIASEMTGNTREAVFAVAHFGGHDITCGVRLGDEAAAYDALRRDLLERYGRRRLPDVVRALDAAFGRDTFSVTDLFIEARRRILAALLGKVIASHDSTIHQIWAETHSLLDYLQSADVPIPETLAVVARRVLEHDTLGALAEVGARLAIPTRVFELSARARKLHLTLNLAPARAQLRDALGRALDLVEEAPAAATVAQAVALIEGGERLGLGLGYWTAQNRFFVLWQSRQDLRDMLAPLARALGVRVVTARSRGRHARTPSRQALSQTVVIENVQPAVDGGRYPAKSEVGEIVEVSADIFKEGHDVLVASIHYRGPGDRELAGDPLQHVDNDRWAGHFPLEQNGRYVFIIEALPDPFLSWLADLEKRVEAGTDVTNELLEGRALIEEAVRRARGDAARDLRAALERLTLAPTQPDAVAVAREPALTALMTRHLDRQHATRSDREYTVMADRERARVAAWYELFPRSARGDGVPATFKDAEAQLERIAAMGFDVVYLPPIHPIGHSFRKGRNNALTAAEDEPGSPWAIGSEEGGHMAVHPGLGTLEDFDRFVEAAARLGLEIALDFAIQCSPDHPYVRDHPEWFFHRPDGTIKYAENPPKKYQDVYPVNFYGPDPRPLWAEMRRIVEFWIGHGVRAFRVDNPHTKPVAFWEWLIAAIQRPHPDVVFLAEAFTRPKMMKVLAKTGFTQSYTYFTWRNTKAELVEYLQEITTPPVADYFRGNLWPNTPDILHETLQTGGQAAFKLRLVLAATLSSLYGIYSGYELGENVPVRMGSEEYLDSEKYEIKARDWNAPGNLVAFVTAINRLRRQNRALHFYRNLKFYVADDPNIVWYGKMTADGDNAVFVAANLDLHGPHACLVDVPLAALGLGPDEPYVMHEQLSDRRYEWRGPRGYVVLDPAIDIAQIFVLHRM